MWILKPGHNKITAISVVESTDNFKIVYTIKCRAVVYYVKNENYKEALLFLGLLTSSW